MRFIILFLFLLSTSSSNTLLKIDSKKTVLSCDTLIDSNSKLSYENIQNQTFTKNNKKSIELSFSPKITLWIRCDLQNTTNKDLKFLLEYTSPITDEVTLFIDDKNITQGQFFIPKNSFSLTPIFELKLKQNESKRYYLSAKAKYTALNTSLILWNKNEFLKKETKHQLILSLFFGAMGILIIYNLFLYLFTKDRTYLYYVLYVMSVTWHHLLYKGFAQLYILTNEASMIVLKFAVLIVSLIVFTAILFTRDFLQTKNYPIIDKIFKAYIYITIFVSIFSIDDFLFDSSIVGIYLPALIMFIFVGFYALYRGNRQAKFYIVGWSVVISSFILMSLYNSYGLFNTFEYFPYFVEFAILFEATLFSIALSDRINQLKKDKNRASQTLINRQNEEKITLIKRVKEKKSELKKSLKEKELLLKELHHRVKNSMQILISLLRLQSSKIKQQKIKDSFFQAQMRISTISFVHEVLYKEKDFFYINTKNYFEKVVKEFKDSFENKEINCILQTNSTLNMSNAIYCGLIINEYLSGIIENYNSVQMEINLKKEDKYMLKIESNYSFKNESLHFLLIKNIIEKYLKGEIVIFSKNSLEIGFYD